MICSGISCGLSPFEGMVIHHTAPVISCVIARNTADDREFSVETESEDQARYSLATAY